MIWMGYLLTSTNRGGSFGACSGWSQLSLQIISTAIAETRTASSVSISRLIRTIRRDHAWYPAKWHVPDRELHVASFVHVHFHFSRDNSNCGFGFWQLPRIRRHLRYQQRDDRGKTNNIYIGPWGSKILYTTNAGSGWSTMSGGPTSTWDMAVCSNGALWVVSPPAHYAGGNYNLWKSRAALDADDIGQMGALNSAAQDVS